MCEWLSSEDWCDVRLLCGGRALGAHRAVLASVSSFLRRLLLSCPIEESPTLIVLPDFDLEAMSAVLYYIYNGEVTIPRQKLEKFLDIVKAMQIFIDRQYSTDLCVGEIDCNLKSSDDEIFVLRAEHDDKQLVTLRKSSQCISQRCGIDYSTAPRNWNEQFKSCLGNLQSSQNRQRDYILRGSFMETYPRNRNINGGAGVPAIPSGSYRATSSLLTNANANGYLISDNYMPSERTVDTAPNLKLSNYSYRENTALELNRILPIANLDKVWKSPVLATHDFWPRSNDEKCTTHLDLNLTEKSKDAPSYSTNSTERYPSFKGSESSISNKINCRNSSQSKVAILNKALENPWCPRLPNSFRPFRRKCHSTNVASVNDTNNNVHQAIKIKNESSLEPTDVLRVQDNDRLADSTRVEKCNDEVLPSAEIANARSTRYACNECGKAFSQLRNFKYHMSVHRGTKEFAASCTVCGKCFNDRGYLSSHMKIHRNRKEYKCTQCPKSFNQRVAYNMHVRIHTGVKPHVCGQCGKAFSRKMLLKQHQRTHSGERPYACPHCDKRFADRSNMTLHLRLHTGIKPFKCPMCPKSFTKKHHLKSHVNFHTGAKPYSCPRCHLAFTQSSNMRTHLKRCTAPEPMEPNCTNAS